MFKILKIGALEPLPIGRIHKIEKQIDLSPIYQRYGNIWSKAKKRLLIDTIINGFDIPKFYFNYFIEENNSLNIHNAIYAVIDGKQRLQAIFEFLNNKFGLDEEFVYYDNPSYELKNLTFSEIAYKYPDIIPLIENYILDVVYIITDEEDKLEELFLRLNGGYALTNAEKRNAIGGYLNKRIRDIVDRNIFFTQKLRFSNTRYQYQDLLSRLLYIESRDTLVSLTNMVLETFIRSNVSQSPLIDKIINQTIEGLDLMSKIFLDKDFLLRGKGIIPVYYYFLTRGDAEYSKTRPFLVKFEETRALNRNQETQNPILINFDRRNQQGVHQDKSLNERFEILQRYFQKFLQYEEISPDTRIETDGIELEEEDSTDQ